MPAYVTVIPICIIFIGLVMLVNRYCKESNKKRGNMIPTIDPRKRASNSSFQTYQDGGNGATATTSGGGNGAGDGGTVIMAGAAALAAVAALDGISADGGGGGNDGGGG